MTSQAREQFYTPYCPEEEAYEREDDSDLIERKSMCRSVWLKQGTLMKDTKTK